MALCEAKPRMAISSRVCKTYHISVIVIALKPHYFMYVCIKATN